MDTGSAAAAAAAAAEAAANDEKNTERIAKCHHIYVIHQPESYVYVNSDSADASPRSALPSSPLEPAYYTYFLSKFKME